MDGWMYGWSEVLEMSIRKQRVFDNSLLKCFFFLEGDAILIVFHDLRSRFFFRHSCSGCLDDFSLEDGRYRHSWTLSSQKITDKTAISQEPFRSTKSALLKSLR